jgi:hypothetical protein
MEDRLPGLIITDYCMPDDALHQMKDGTLPHSVVNSWVRKSPRHSGPRIRAKPPVHNEKRESRLKHLASNLNRVASKPTEFI